MNYSEEASVQVSLPQFSEINSRSNSGFTSSAADLQAAANAIYTTAAGPNHSKHQQILVSIDLLFRYSMKTLREKFKKFVICLMTSHTDKGSFVYKVLNFDFKITILQILSNFRSHIINTAFILKVNSQTKYPGAILSWPDPNTLIQLCEKQGLQAINIPNYSQAVSNNASILSVQSNSLPVRIIPNMYISPVESNASKQDVELKSENVPGNSNSVRHFTRFLKIPTFLFLIANY